MKKLLFGVLIGVAFTGLVGCGTQNKAVEAEAQVLADAFEAGDMDTIQQTIFGTGAFTVDEELSDIWGETTEPEPGILSYLFDLVTVKVKKVTDHTIEYEIQSPDMSKVFVDLVPDAATISEEELLEQIKDYAQHAETMESDVSVEYILVDDQPMVLYQDEDFINAVTGGLLEAYQALYAQMMETYTESGDAS